MGLVLRDTPAGASTSLWPYGLLGYALLAAFVPWIASISGGAVQSNDLTLRVSVYLAVVVGVPSWLAIQWLAATPYRAVRMAAWLLIAGCCVHGIAALVYRARRTATSETT
jgi:hypothetical protein